MLKRCSQRSIPEVQREWRHSSSGVMGGTTAAQSPSGAPPRTLHSMESSICLSQSRSLSPFPICKGRIILFIPWGSSEGLGDVYTWLLKYKPLRGQPLVWPTELRLHACTHISEGSQRSPQTEVALPSPKATPSSANNWKGNRQPDQLHWHDNTFDE